ncbi:hypothetical protein TSTA_110910 [Talaromyces stipitatus ATCC 10500]|uniref:Uncharacterized protein n=1 Tax=Talaromyces stipitatus (strain ATCC 10500 / CBS 375.48 / QM 6759 / NRRL 1006) TaxID=441959 RepID=B8MV22_TALSN|nr:uncharacterized protein TSTA_110910 [Talaromyces stipitatus ATCC 10500]EED11912.1 hypothetical protein TSTA_110910 [Talaromyces stipitatus ATCC 10500]
MDDITEETLERILRLHSFLILPAFQKRSKPGFTEALTAILTRRGLAVDPEKLNGCEFYGPLDWVTGQHLTSFEIKDIARIINFPLPAQRKRPETAAQAVPEVPTQAGTKTEGTTVIESTTLSSTLTPITMSEPTPVPGWITSIFQTNIQPHISYSKTQYKRDVVYILTLLRRISEEQQTQFAGLIRETDYTQARALAACMDTAKYEEFLAIARDAINSSGYPANNIETFRLFMERFRAGPSERAPTEIDIANGQPGTDTGNYPEERRGQLEAIESREPSGRQESSSSGQSHQNTMQESLTECIFQLEQRFKKSSFEARQEADKLKFRFAKEKDLPLREYVERKVILLQEANIKEEDEIVTRVWENLDPVIMNTIRQEDLSLDEFTRRLFLREVPARLAWNQLNRFAPTHTSPRAYPKSKYKDDKPERQKDKQTEKDTKKEIPSKRE